MTEPTPPKVKKGPRHALHPARRTRRRAGPFVVVGRALVALVSLAILAASGVGWAGQRDLLSGIITSQVLEGEPDSPGDDQNILIMGLDSRLDQYGRPLPQELYDALHAGDETTGGYNANVLIVLHVPGDGGPIVAISIPRDDYVDLAGCKGSEWECKGKIKEAYGQAYQRELESTQQDDTSGDKDDKMAREQDAREAGRRAEISTVRQLLGIPIDHFVEVTLAAFFQIAEVVQPLTVCLNEDTADDFSGADFHKGVQQIDAAQAMAFVRQRRALNDETFTDMDRTRRQQAFIASLINAVKESGALKNPTKLRELVDVAKQNVAVDSGFDLPAFAKRATTLADSPLSLYTLPIAEFSKTSAGEDINIIDVPTIRAIVQNLVSGGSPTATTTTTTPTTPPQPAVLDVLNASSYDGLADVVRNKLAANGLTAGQATSGDSLEQTTRIEYGTDARKPAETLADQLDLIAKPSDALAPNHMLLTLGTDFPADDYLNATTTTTSTTGTTSETSSSPVATAAATATGTKAPVPTELSRMTTAGGVPCVK